MEMNREMIDLIDGISSEMYPNAIPKVAQKDIPPKQDAAAMKALDKVAKLRAMKRTAAKTSGNPLLNRARKLLGTVRVAEPMDDETDFNVEEAPMVDDLGLSPMPEAAPAEVVEEKVDDIENRLEVVEEELGLDEESEEDEELEDEEETEEVEEETEEVEEEEEVEAEASLKKAGEELKGPKTEMIPDKDATQATYESNDLGGKEIKAPESDMIPDAKAAKKLTAQSESDFDAKLDRIIADAVEQKSYATGLAGDEVKSGSVGEEIPDKKEQDQYQAGGGAKGEMKNTTSTVVPTSPETGRGAEAAKKKKAVK